MCGAAYRLPSEGQGTKVEDPSPGDHILRHLVGGEECIRPRVPVEGEVPVSIFRRFDKRQGGVAVGVHYQAIHRDACLQAHLAQKMAKLVIPHLAEKRRPLAQLGQHGQHITGRAAGVGLIKGIALGTGTVAGEVHQQLPQSHHIILFFHRFHRLC